jgi:hypothetical protein
MDLTVNLSRNEWGFSCIPAAGQGYNHICQQDIIEIQPYIPVGLRRGTAVYASRAE